MRREAPEFSSSSDSFLVQTEDSSAAGFFSSYLRLRCGSCPWFWWVWNFRMAGGEGTGKWWCGFWFCPLPEGGIPSSPDLDGQTGPFSSQQSSLKSGPVGCRWSTVCLPADLWETWGGTRVTGSRSSRVTHSCSVTWCPWQWIMRSFLWRKEFCYLRPPGSHCMAAGEYNPES